MNPIKKLLGQTAIYGLSSIIGRLLNYLLVPLHLYVFKSPSDYGDVAILYSWVAFLVVFLTFGMETTFFRFIQNAVDKAKIYNQAFTFLLVVNGLFLLLLTVYNQEIADYLLFSEHSEYILLLGLIVTIDSLTSLPLAKLRAEEKALQFAGVQFSSIGVNILFNLVFLLIFFNNDRPQEGVLFILLANLLASVCKPLLLLKEIKDFKFHFDLQLAKEMLFYSFPIVIAGFAGIINETIDRILLERVLFESGNTLTESKAQVGIYSAVYKLAMLITIFLQAYRYAAEPFFFSQMKSKDNKVIYVKTMNFFVAAVCLVFLIVSLNMDIFKYFITNEAYRVGLPIVPILLMANVFFGIYLNQSIWYKLSGQTRFGAYISIGGAILTIVLNYLFIPSYGYYACAWTTMTVYASQMLASYFLGQKHYPIPYNIRKFFLYLTSAVLIFFLVKLLNIQNSWLSFFINNGLISVFVYLVWNIEKKAFSKS